MEEFASFGISIFYCALKNTVSLIEEKPDYEGFHNRPMRWERVAQKFHRLGESYTDASLRNAILEAIRNLEWISVIELTQLLSQVKEGISHGQ